MSSPSDFLSRLEAVGLARHASRLEQLGLPSIRLRSQPGYAQQTQRGPSRLGGRPDVAASFRWPAFRGSPLSFIAQIDLGEVHSLDTNRALPESGLLSFFYDSEQSVWGFDPADDGAWAVIYTPAGAELVTEEFPDDLSEEARFRPVRLVPEVEQTWAPWESREVEALGLTREERLAYAELIEEDATVVHRLLGHPDPVQGDMQLECQLVSHGLYCGDSSGYQDPKAEMLAAGAVDWRLLLQIDSDDDAAMMWGDVGRLYFWIHKDALGGRRWQEARLILQCA